MDGLSARTMFQSPVRPSKTLRGLEKSAYTLTISHANRATVRLPRIEIATSTIEIPEILLPSQAEISGVVKDPNGRTIVGARVLGRNMQENIIEETVSNGDGRFALTQFPRGANVLLWAEATGHVATNQRVEAPHNDVVLVLQRLGVLSGHVEDSDTGSAITDFRLLMAGGSEMGRFHSADGHFRWEDLPPGRWTLTAQAPGYQSANISDVEIHAGEVKEGIVFSLLKGVEVSGRVVDDATGEPLPGVRVSYRGSDDATSPTFFRSKTVSQDTDADGAFRLDGLPPTGVTLVVRSPLYAERQVRPSAEVGTAIEIRLSSGSEISGRVLGTDSLTPVVGARVSLFSENNGTGTTIASDSNGFFGFNHLQAGLYRVTAEATFGQASRQDIIVQENQRTDGILLNIKPGATLHGRITGTLPNEQPNINLIVRGPGGFSVFGSTDLEGSYRIEGVPAGSLELVASTSLFRSISTSIQVPEGIQDTVFNFEFPWAGRLRGTITQGGKPASFTNVALIPVDDQMVRGSTTTDSEGAYEVSGVSDGDYIIRVQKQRTVEESVRITGDTILDIEVPPME